jgi:myo-inositol-1(or 4)-monophosphatase
MAVSDPAEAGTATHADDLALLEDAARAAGALAFSFFVEGARTAAAVNYKDGGSPVTEADLAADRLLHARCMGARPGYGWLSEETADSADRLGRRRCFVVDPIDGTRAFVNGWTEWCVSAAVVEDGLPVAGVIVAPVTGEVFAASLGGGATLNGQPLRLTTTVPPARDALVEGPRPLVDELVRATGLPLRRHARVYSLAYRIMMAAKGSIDLALATPASHDWDIAAADLIIREAGGVLLEAGVDRPRYNRARLQHGVLAGGAEALARPLLASLAGRY